MDISADFISSVLFTQEGSTEDLPAEAAGGSIPTNMQELHLLGLHFEEYENGTQGVAQDGANTFGEYANGCANGGTAGMADHSFPQMSEADSYGNYEEKPWSATNTDGAIYSFEIVNENNPTPSPYWEDDLTCSSVVKKEAADDKGNENLLLRNALLGKTNPYEVKTEEKANGGGGVVVKSEDMFGDASELGGDTVDEIFLSEFDTFASYNEDLSLNQDLAQAIQQICETEQQQQQQQFIPFMQGGQEPPDTTRPHKRRCAKKSKKEEDTSNNNDVSHANHNSCGNSNGGNACSSMRKERSLHHCFVCNKGFKDKYSVNVHIRTHTGEKPFACNVCGKKFRQKAHLAKHQHTHFQKKTTSPPSCSSSSSSASVSSIPNQNTILTVVKVEPQEY